MTEPAASPFDLTGKDLEVMKRFFSILDDTGIQVAMLGVVLEELYGNTDGVVELSVAAFKDALRDIRLTGPSDIWASAPSLSMVVDVLRDVDDIPEDFVPSQELIDKCLEHFFEDKRQRVATGK